jgi:hypothetical protein
MHISGQSTGVTGVEAMAHRLPEYWFESRRRYYIKNFGVPYAMATDVLAIAAHAMGGAKERLLRRSGKYQPHLIGDLWRNSTLFRANRAIAPSVEYRPPAAVADPAQASEP